MAGLEAPLMVAWELTGEGMEKGKERRGRGRRGLGGQLGGRLGEWPRGEGTACRWLPLRTKELDVLCVR
jgi:hypothetical protein